MSFAERMMKMMMGKMSSDDRKAMMDRMMEHFFADMSSEEKHQLMKEMMPKMMGQMMGSGSPMIGMMGAMMAKRDEGGGEDFNPMEMCREMMSTFSDNNAMISLMTPEIRTLFQEWEQQLKDEVLNLISQGRTIELDSIAKELKITKESAAYFVCQLAREDKVKLEIHNLRQEHTRPESVKEEDENRL